MSSNDLFGIERERSIKDSGIREIFTPHHPVDSVELFFGREQEVRSLVEAINTPGQHALLYGDRGVGKSSLAGITADLLLRAMAGKKIFKKGCDGADTFESLMLEPLEHYGILSAPVAREERSKRTEKAEIGFKGAVAGRTGETEVIERFTIAGLRPVPSDIADYLSNKPGLLLIDEAEAIRRKGDRERLAELMKLLSDKRSPFKILVVGISETGSMLLAGHPSVGRCIREVELERMGDDEIEKIVVGGAEKAGLHFEKEVIESIVSLSAGYPHFTHLLALKCAEQVIGNGGNIITMNVLFKAKSLAINDVARSLREKYEAATMSNKTSMFGTVLRGAAKLNPRRFNAEEWREEIRKITGETITQGGLNNYLNRLVSDGEETVLRRVAVGIYRFNDPRMISFIRIVHD